MAKWYVAINVEGCHQLEIAAGGACGVSRVGCQNSWDIPDAFSPLNIPVVSRQLLPSLALPVRKCFGMLNVHLLLKKYFHRILKVQSVQSLGTSLLDASCLK